MAEQPVEKIEIHGTAGDWAFLAALNVLIDVLATYDPHLGDKILAELTKKQNELKADPATEPSAKALSVVIGALAKSARALQRTPPAGQA